MTGTHELGGRRLIAEGREAEIYEWDEGLVLRLMRSPLAGPTLARSTLASEAARSKGINTPKVFEIIEVHGRPAQVMERVDGHDMFTHIASNPLRIVSAARTLAEVHADLHKVEAPLGLEEIHGYLSQRIAGSDLVPADVSDAALTALADLPEGMAVCHGDYHPGNLLLTEAGSVLIDWTGATRGDATADFARTTLMLRIGELPPGAPGIIRLLASVGRGVLLRLYSRSYRKAMPVDNEMLEAWTIVCVANRLVDGIGSEREALLDLARRSSSY